MSFNYFVIRLSFVKYIDPLFLLGRSRNFDPFLFGGLKIKKNV
jgi:hypothetical protein